MLVTPKEIYHVARALWQYEIDHNEHNEPFELSWYRGQARAAIKALKGMKNA